MKIIGVGSPFGDDRLGWVVAERLQSAALLVNGDEQVSILSLDRPGPSIISHWRDADTVIVIDAVRSGARPGTVHWLDARAIDSGPGSTSSHGFGIAAAIDLAKTLGQLPQQVYLCGVEIDATYTGEGLSPAVSEAIPLLLERIEALARRPVSHPANAT
ncbi:MAG: hydrogenase maturation protease [Acidiferrobacterales bacterium]|nr:hydrogenase maturation protease [Acidiferrobacterales bacterium]